MMKPAQKLKTTRARTPRIADGGPARAAATTGARAAALLGPGLHGGVVEMAAAGATGDAPRAYRVRLLSGERITAVRGDVVEEALVDECLRTGKLVLLADGERGPTIFGALQTSRGLDVDAEGHAVLRARTVRLQGDEGVVVEAGGTSLRLEESGAARMQGDRMVIDMGSHVRVLSALVELP